MHWMQVQSQFPPQILKYGSCKYCVILWHVITRQNTNIDNLRNEEYSDNRKIVKQI